MKMKDKWWDIFEFFEYEVNLFEKSRSHEVIEWMGSDVPLSERKYFKFYFRADQIKNNYKREEYDLLQYFGDIGGLLEIVTLVGWYMSFALVSRLFQSALVKSTYRKQEYSPGNTQYYETRIAGVVTPETSSSSDSSDEDKAEDMKS